MSRSRRSGGPLVCSPLTHSIPQITLAPQPKTRRTQEGAVDGDSTGVCFSSLHLLLVQHHPSTDAATTFRGGPFAASWHAFDDLLLVSRSIDAASLGCGFLAISVCCRLFELLAWHTPAQLLIDVPTSSPLSSTLALVITAALHEVQSDAMDVDAHAAVAAVAAAPPLADPKTVCHTAMGAHTHTHTHTDTCTRRITRTHAHTHTLKRALTQTRAHTRARVYAHAHAHAHTHTHT
jgi:hypothetical protein